MKSRRKIGCILLFALLGFSIYLLMRIATFNLFDSGVVLLKEFNVTDKDYRMKICYVPPNATLQSCIQIRKVENGIDSVINNFDRYNYLKSYKIKNDTLFIIVDDTLRNHVKEKLFKIKLP